ncbi:MAG: tetratricopeptide repeat protein [Rubrivivax sp.]
MSTDAPASRVPQAELLQWVHLFGAGRHAEMEVLAAQAAVRHPQDGLAWKALGTALLAQGKDALAALQRAAALMPQDVEVLGNLGGLLAARGQHEPAARHYRAALALKPDFAEAHSNLGDVLASLGQWDAAAASCLQALRLRPALAAAHCNLGRARAGQGRLDDAVASYRRAIGLQPRLAQAHHGLGLALQAQGRLDAAAASLREALRWRPQHLAAQFQLAHLLAGQGRFDDAVAAYRQALAIEPGHAEALANLGVALMALGCHAEAAAAFQQSLQRQPAQPAVRSNLGNAWLALGRIDDALADYRAAVAAQPDFAPLQGNLAHALNLIGEPAQALAHLERAQMLEPERLAWRSEWLFTRQYLDRSEAGRAETLAAARRFGAAAAARAQPFRHPSGAAAADPQRRLRIGLLSGDLRAHPVAWFLESVLAQWSRRPTLELWAYATQPQADAVTQRLRACCAQWRQVEALDDPALAAAIHADGIDVLIDLSGHTRHNRLPVLAWRPAPLQLSWLGSCASTGLAEVDALVVDRWIAPAGTEADFVEPLLRLPHGFLCFTPPPAVDDAPIAAAPGEGLRLACFNRLAKIGDEVVAAWLAILAGLPGSSLALQDRALASETVCRRLRERFAAHGLDPQRLRLRPAQPREAYLAAYRAVDLALDPFPYPGGTTTVEALWMGVPVLTLAGASALGRQGAGILARLGLDDWVAADADDYVGRALRLGRDRAALAGLRTELRGRLLASPLCDAAGFAQALESALRERWRPA